MTDSPSADERPDSRQPALRPKDAATLVLVDSDGPEPRLLMGRRRADLVFMPGKYVFPGGRVDRADRTQAAADELGAAETTLLMQRMQGRPSPTRARGLALAAVREAFEEAGIVIGRASADMSGDRPASPGPAWQPFLATGHLPALARLSLVARAITPPGRARRYDTRFFLAPAAAIALQTPHRDDELSHIDWFTLDEVRALDLPGITRAIVEDVAQRLSDGPSSDGAIPFYYFQAGAFRRERLAPDGARAPSEVWRR